LSIEPRYLSIDQACIYCGYGRKLLISRIRAGELAGGRRVYDKRRTWFVDRRSLDRWMQGQFFAPDPDAIESKVVDFLSRRA